MSNKTPGVTGTPNAEPTTTCVVTLEPTVDASVFKNGSFDRSAMIHYAYINKNESVFSEKFILKEIIVLISHLMH